VEEEFHRAEEAGREILVFRKRIAAANEAVTSFLRRADVKYASFESVLELREAVHQAIDQSRGFWGSAPGRQIQQVRCFNNFANSLRIMRLYRLDRPYRGSSILTA
jgi:hypothetical protein